MSPPCQPHTWQHSNQRFGIEIVLALVFLPGLILLENVVGLELEKSCGEVSWNDDDDAGDETTLDENVTGRGDVTQQKAKKELEKDSSDDGMNPSLPAAHVGPRALTGTATCGTCRARRSRASWGFPSGSWRRRRATILTRRRRDLQLLAPGRLGLIASSAFRRCAR